MEPIHLRNKVRDTLEIFDHPEFIASFAKWISPKNYLEYGTRDCRTIQRISPHCSNVWGVDIYKHQNTEKIPNLKFFQMKTDDFSEKLPELNVNFELAFIDADHSHVQVVKDFDCIFPYIMDNGFIFLHDTFPIDEKYTTKELCHDCWKTPLVLKQKYGDSIEMITIPVQPGLTCVRKVKLLDWMKM